jgi:hypothetical protein
MLEKAGRLSLRSFFMSQFRSALNHFLLKMRNRLRWTRHHYIEKPIGTLTNIAPEIQARIESLKKSYNVSYESEFDRFNTLENYLYLGLLDGACKRLNFPFLQAQTIVDVGSRSFYYARVLSDLFKPRKLTGIELDAFPLYRNLHTRYSYAQSYVKDLPGTSYLAADFLAYNEACDGMTMFYPFVTEYPLLAWDLPLTHFQPQQIFNHAFKLLPSGGWLFMVNHGEDEWQVAKRYAESTGFLLKGFYIENDSLAERTQEPVVSYFIKPG